MRARDGRAADRLRVITALYPLLEAADERADSNERCRPTSGARSTHARACRRVPALPGPSPLRPSGRQLSPAFDRLPPIKALPSSTSLQVDALRFPVRRPPEHLVRPAAGQSSEEADAPATDDSPGQKKHV